MTTWNLYKQLHRYNPSYANDINAKWKNGYYEALYANKNKLLEACDDRTRKAAFGLGDVELNEIGECFMCKCKGNSARRESSGERCDHRCGAAYPYSEADGGGASECGEGRECSFWGWCH